MEGRGHPEGWKQIGELVLEVCRSTASRAKGKRLERSPETAAGTNKAVVCCCVSPRVSPGLWETKIRAHPDAGEAVDHLLDRGRVWEVEHERHCEEAHKKGEVLIDEYFHLQSRLFGILLSFSPLFLRGYLKKYIYIGLPHYFCWP